MKNSLNVLALICLLCLGIFSGCGGGGGGGGGGNGPAISSYTVQFNIFDKTSGKKLSDVALTIEETGQQFIINGSHTMELEKGTYTVYFIHADYITRGFVFRLTSNLTFNTYLTPEEDDDEDPQPISGRVLSSTGEPQEDYYNIYAGNPFTAKCVENLTDSFYIEDVVAGEIVVSAFTVRDGKIDLITYAGPGMEREIELQFSASGTEYSGTKPPDGKFIVKQNDGYFLAGDENSGSGYSFNVKLLPGDSIILESIKEESENTYFTRVNAGNKGGTHNLSYLNEVAGFTCYPEGKYYRISFSQVGFADYYEVIALQANSAGGKVLFWNAVLSGTSVKVPESILYPEKDNPETDNIYIILRAVKLPDFNIANFLNESPDRICPAYSYTDKMQMIPGIAGTNNAELHRHVSGASSKESFAHARASENLSEIRRKLNLNYLCIE